MNTVLLILFLVAGVNAGWTGVQWLRVRLEPRPAPSWRNVFRNAERGERL